MSDRLTASGPRCVWDARRTLGEGAWWSGDDQALYWLDIKRPAILRYSPADQRCEEWPSPELIGCFAPRAAGGFVGAFRAAIACFTLDEPGIPISPEVMSAPQEHGADDRFNDGKCHPDGSFWAGTMDDAEARSTGHFYRYDGETLKRLSGPHKVCNGPAFSPDGRVAYLTDSAAQTVYRRDVASGNTTVFRQFREGDGYPDGMTTDSKGRLWIAFWDGWQVRCFSPEGELLLVINLPVARPTSCAFGGPDRDMLYITSASFGLDEAERAAQPLAGGLFACTIEGAKGWPAPAFAG